MALHGFREWFADRKARIFFPLLLAVVTAGCVSGFGETHFFRSESQRDGIPNYFRLTVSGYTVLCSSRYISGLFEEDIINQYFNEIGQPEGGRLIPLGQKSKTEETKSSDGKLSDRGT